MEATKQESQGASPQRSILRAQSRAGKGLGRQKITRSTPNTSTREELASGACPPVTIPEGNQRIKAIEKIVRVGKNVNKLEPSQRGNGSRGNEVSTLEDSLAGPQKRAPTVTYDPAVPLLSSQEDCHTYVHGSISHNCHKAETM